MGRRSLEVSPITVIVLFVTVLVVVLSSILSLYLKSLKSDTTRVRERQSSASSSSIQPCPNPNCIRCQNYDRIQKSTRRRLPQLLRHYHHRRHPHDNGVDLLDRIANGVRSELPLSSAPSSSSPSSSSSLAAKFWNWWRTKPTIRNGAQHANTNDTKKREDSRSVDTNIVLAPAASGQYSRNYTPRPSHPSFRHSLPPHPLDTMLHRHHQSTSFYYKSTFVLSATASGVSTIPPPPPVPPPPLPTRHLPRRAGRCSTSSTRAVPSTATSICAHRPSRRSFKRHGPAVPSHHRRKKSQPHLAQSSHFHLHLVHLFHAHPEPAGVAVYSGISPSKQRVRTYAHET